MGGKKITSLCAVNTIRDSLAIKVAAHTSVTTLWKRYFQSVQLGTQTLASTEVGTSRLNLSRDGP